MHLFAESFERDWKKQSEYGILWLCEKEKSLGHLSLYLKFF